jgi:hypothetical protein
MTSLFDIATQIEAAAAEPYLRSNGWELVHQGELGNRWRLRMGAKTRNVAVPLRGVDSEDQWRMLAAVLQTLAEVEQRDPATIARDLREAAYDLVEFRLVAESLTNGEMPLNAAPELTKGAFEAIQAAARAEVARRAHYAQGTLPSQVRSFVNSAVLAGTDRGSVILRIRGPAAAQPREPEIDGVSNFGSFARRATRRLVGGVQAAKTASHRDPVTLDADILDEDVDDGLSANLCDALCHLSGAKAGLDARIDLRVRWALTQPTSTPSSQIVIERGEVAELERVAAILKEIEPRPGTSVTGPVVQIRHEPGGSESAVVISAEVDGRVRAVRMHLDRTDWKVAAQAHIREREIRATGTLERAGTTRELTETTRIEIV